MQCNEDFVSVLCIFTETTIGMPTFNVELNHKPKRNGLYTLLLRVTLDRKHKRISLGRHIKEKEFNRKGKDGKWVRTNHPNHKSLNSHIKKFILEQQERFNNEDEDLGLVGNKKHQTADDIFDFVDLHISRLRALNKYRTAEKRTHIFNKLEKYLGSRKMPFKKLTTTFLKDYEVYLQSKIGNHPNTIYTDMKGIKSVLNEAIIEGKLNSSPFLQYRLKTVQTFKERLTFKEIEEIERLELGKGSWLWHARNYFMFSYYTAGVRFGDFTQLKWRHIKDGYLDYTMDKTAGTMGSFKSIKLFEGANDILAYYMPDKIVPEHFIFPLLDNEKDYKDLEFLKKQISSKNALVNKYLKKIAEKAKISKKVSFHVSRHSFADHARQKSQDIYGISKALGHSSIQITQQYLENFDQDSVDKTMGGMFGK